MLMLESLDGSLDARVNHGNVNLLISQHESVSISVKSGLFLHCLYCFVLRCYLLVDIIFFNYVLLFMVQR